MNIYLVTGLVLLVYMVVVWFLGTLLHLQGSNLWILRIGLWVIGIAAAGAFLWFKRKEQRQRAGEAGDAGGQGHEEIDSLLRDAEAKLAAGRIEGGAKLGNLPAIFLIGEAGSTKTSIMIHSGLEPELIGGQVFQDTAVVPTRSANLWFARRTVFVEAGGRLMADQAGWQRLMRRLRPGKLATAFGKGQQAPRAAIVCFDCESFVRAGSTDAVAAASRSLHARLAGVSQQLGINLPVYVLFTRTDRLPFFNEYVRNLSNEEATQVLGATLPFAPRSSGVYAEQEAQRLTGAFNDLYYSLCDKRPEFLAREHEGANLAGIYEFAREFRKLRAPIVQFLVDLARPSQLTTGPFLRGFYFSGVRPIFVSDVTPAVVAPSQQGRQGFEAAAEATGFFRTGQAQQPMPAPTPSRGAKRVPQWCFIGHLFNDVVLEDKVAMGASGATVQANTLRRVLLGSAAALCLMLTVGLLVSYGNNKDLESGALQAAAGIPAVEVTGTNIAPLDALQRLETLRQQLVVLTGYENDGAPWSLRWGLYSGHDLYPELRALYFKRFHQLLFGQVQSMLEASLSQLPPTGGPAYAPTYQTLKAYLITTSNHDKSTQMFLSPVLLDRWSAGRNFDPDRLQLAQKQFDFYAEELKAANPFSTENDTLAVERARSYLKRFSGGDSVYQYMLAEAEKASRPVSFHQIFPAAGQAVVDRTIVPGAFTKAGWVFMQNAFKNPSQYFSGEQWVMGAQGATGVDAATIDQLRKRYQDEYTQHWREFIRSGSVVRYASLRDANEKLKILSGPQSPLLQLFSLVSKNTAVGVPEVDGMFRAAQSVVPPPGDVPASPANQPYMTGLVGLQNSLDSVANQPGAPNEQTAAPIMSQEQSAKGKVGEMALTFGNDPEAGTVRKLLEAPITNVDPLLRGLGAQTLNGAGKSFCSQYNALMRKYPFNAGSSEMAELQEVNAIFKPKDGELWKFYDATLKNILPRQGSHFVPGPTTGFTISPRFVSFLERAAAFSDALYHGGADPHMEFQLRPTSPNVQTLQLSIEGQSYVFPGGAPTFRKYAWPGGTHEVKLSGKMKDGNEFSSPANAYQGLWAAFVFFDDTENWRQTGATNSLEWKQKVGRTGRVTASVQFELDMSGAPPVFQRGYLSGLACVAEVAH